MAQSALRNISPTWWKDIKPQAPQKPVGQQMSDVLGGMALATAPIPVVGDVAGAVSDAAMYAAYPEERTMLNAGMSLAGLLPFVPGAGGVRAAEKAADALDMSQVKDIDPRKIIEIHGIQDRAKFDALVSSMQRGGWQGRPILAVENANNGMLALTGSHRIAAARKAGINVPVKYADSDAVEKQLEATNQTYDDLIGSGDDRLEKFLRDAGDIESAQLMAAEQAAEGLDMSQAARTVGKASKAADDLPALTAKALIDTPEFKNFFGKSKVVDAEGKPLIVYHGTNADFAEFSLKKAGSSGIPRTGKDKVIFATSSPDNASQYAYAATNWPAYYAALRAGDNQTKAREAARAGKNVMPLYLRMENPLVIDVKGRVTTNRDTINKALKNIGEHDGIILKNVRSMHPDEVPADHYVVFNPANIRSVNAAFDPAKRNSSKLMAGIMGGAVGLSALRNINQQEEK